MRLRNTYKICLLICLVLLVYLPAIKNPISNIDDIFIVEAFGPNGKMTLHDVLLPGKGFYYRPLINLTFFLDARLWGLEPSFMHLENVLLHALNVVLVFLLAIKVADYSTIKMPHLPVLSALLFAFHPINTEPVNWIAARTDPLAAFFVLTSLYFFLKGWERNRSKYTYTAIGFAVLGVLAKETAIMVIPGAVLLALQWKKNQNKTEATSGEGAKAILPVLITFALMIVPLLLHLVNRVRDNSVSTAFSGNGLGLFNRAVLAIQAFGFYVKKLFLPLPLNFAILSINSNYIWLGFLSILLLLLLLRKGQMTWGVLALSGLFIMPALIVAVNRMAWTPYAERYLYIPSAFFSIGFVGSCLQVPVGEKIGKVIPAGIALVVLLTGWMTVQRTLLWQDNLALLADTATKSPQFGVIHNELALLLAKKGRYDEALQHLDAAQKLSNTKEVSRFIALNKIGWSLYGKSTEEAKVILLQAIGDKRTADPELLKLLNRYDESTLAGEKDEKARCRLAREMIETNLQLAQRTGDLQYLYRNGQLTLRFGEKKEAAVYFKKAAQAPEGAYYRQAARKLADTLGQE